ncbi:hypothetical protein IAE16_06155 [Hydrogenobacter sp. T-2]|nr:hypothetical protein [Hydrogenobacter sp. T-2]WPM31400.1 hypothetical protein IAE16_06155 [Hydrogenobacter sp. T-2]
MKEEFSADGMLIGEERVLLIKNPSDVWTFREHFIHCVEIK